MPRVKDNCRTFRTNPTTSNQPYVPRGKRPLIEAPKKPNDQDAYFKCGGKGHMGYQCSTKANLHIGGEHEELNQDVEGEENREDLVYNDDDLADLDVDTSLTMVVRCILATHKHGKEDWRTTAIFQMLGKELHKLVIDGGSCMNVVSAPTVGRVKLPTKPHPQPYQVAWIDNTIILVTECLVSKSYD